MRCIHCHQDLPLTSFNKDKRTKNGLRTNCRDCQSSFAKKFNALNLRNPNEPTTRFSSARSNALKRNISWSIAYEEYIELIKNNCYYCSAEIKTVGVGLDRLNNNLGYEVENVVACCKACNLGRNQFFTPEEWKIAMVAVMRYRRG